MRYVLAFVLVLAAFLSGAARASYTQPIYISNTSSGVTDAQVAAALPAFQAATTLDFAPIWGTDATLILLPPGVDAPFMAWTITIENNFGVAALGYHDVLEAVPLAKVFPDPTGDDGSWQITFTHELFEMLADPYTDRAVRVQRRFYPFYLQEVGDPVEADSLAYKRMTPAGPVLISDFVTPFWFRAGTKQPVDFARHLTRPLVIAKGGYQIAWDKRVNRWTELCYLNKLCRSWQPHQRR